jgi:hypothetical protein
MSATEAREVLSSFYDKTYGISDHAFLAPEIRKLRPLAGIAMHEAEDNVRTSSLFEAIDLYDMKEIGDAFKMSLQEFLDLPRDVYIKVLQVATKRQNTKAGVVDNVSRELRNIQTKK